MELFSYGNYENIPLKLPVKLESTPSVRAEDLTKSGIVSVKIFDLNKSDDLAEYAELRQKEADGLCEVVIDKQWVPENNTWKILVEVLEYYWTFTKEALEELTK